MSNEGSFFLVSKSEYDDIATERYYKQQQKYNDSINAENCLGDFDKYFDKYRFN